ncbi:hypothetical protein [Pseudobdellovibrio exovorus]|uniref:Uncharacterized protein n=1 Tax=Pseudobdellovibrio exovorus JSS TaxID=1184267 RepID=M4VAE3_9BACT|nr:hypothetical protein [Pseudobdellovibrio exovorus]AGH95440.1 hypothetical protein A11Q_1224 [Pseudobdellovibrio exovorus JSS]
MLRQAFAYFSDAHLTVLGFLLFFGTFLGVLIWTFMVQETSFYQQLSMQPLKDGGENEP